MAPMSPLNSRTFFSVFTSIVCGRGTQTINSYAMDEVLKGGPRQRRVLDQIYARSTFIYLFLIGKHTGYRRTSLDELLLWAPPFVLRWFSELHFLKFGPDILRVISNAPTRRSLCRGLRRSPRAPPWIAGDEHGGGGPGPPADELAARLDRDPPSMRRRSVPNNDVALLLLITLLICSSRRG